MAALEGFGRFTYIASLSSVALSDLAVACRTNGDVPGEATCIKALGDIALARSDHAAAQVPLSRRRRCIARSGPRWAKPPAL